MEQFRRNKISTRAYYKWENAGRPCCDGKEFWDCAEREIVAEELKRMGLASSAKKDLRSEGTMAGKKTKFKIESVKWSWAAAVQSKGVYRDAQFVRTKTKAGAIKAIDFLMTQPRGLTYAITVKRKVDDDKPYFTYWQHSMPCLGGLVKYRDSHGPKYFMNPYFPRDISVAFPEGDITFVACQANTKAMKNDYGEFIFSEESPWIAAFGSKDTIIFKDTYFILTNMNTDPTVFYSFMRLAGVAYYYASPYAAKKWHPKAEILASKTGMADPRRLAGQKPLKISGGTWAEGFGYTRPYNESIFKTDLPHKLADFGKLGGYPQAPYTNTYFVTEMKKVFGVEIPKALADPKVGDVLLKAWDYFKEKSKELSDTTEKAGKVKKSIYK